MTTMTSDGKIASANAVSVSSGKLTTLRINFPIRRGERPCKSSSHSFAMPQRKAEESSTR